MAKNAPTNFLHVRENIHSKNKDLIEWLAL